MKTAFLPFLVTIETDPTRFHGEHAQAPALPGRSGCEQMLAHLSADLELMLPAAAELSIALPGALYDQTQILRPGLPVFQALQEALAVRARESMQPRRLALTIDQVQNRDDALAPDPAVQPGLLLNLPLVLLGDADVIEALSDAMEHRFLEEGQLSAHSARALESHFAVNVNHARFMTLTDLRAMLKLQLDHFRFSGLWELLDAAIENMEKPVRVSARGGQSFEYREGAVHCRFEPFDFWARLGAGSSLHGESGLAEAYVEWTREYRQYVTTLDAHRVPLIHHPANAQCVVIENEYLVETSLRTPKAGEAELTEHSWDDVGVIAVTVLDGEHQQNYYPLSAAGLNSLHRAIRSRGLGPGGFAYPGRIVHDPSSRMLMPDKFAAQHG